MKVSVIIPAFNCANLITDAIESTLRQNYKDFEVIIIDDGSTDGTKDRLQSYVDVGNVKYHYQKNKGLPGARNTGIRLSQGEYVLCLDADDELPPDAISSFVNDAVTSQAKWIISDIIRNELGKSELQEAILPKDNYLISILSKKTYFRSCFYHKNTLKELGLYDEAQKYYEDWDLYIRLIEKGIPFSYINKPLYIYKVREGSITKQSRLTKNYFYIERIYKKHYKRLADSGRKDVGNLYADYMWRLASDYFFKSKSIRDTLRCFLESVKYDSMVFPKYFMRVVARLTMRKCHAN